MDKEKVKIEKLTFAFAKEIISLVTAISDKDIRFTIGKQLLKSGTSIGANIEEAQGGISRRDFIHGMNIAKKEARETLYWLKLLNEFDFVNKKDLERQISDCKVLVNILTAIVKTSQGE